MSSPNVSALVSFRESSELAEAFAKAETARAKTVIAEEKVNSARELERAQRTKAIELISAEVASTAVIVIPETGL